MDSGHGQTLSAADFNSATMISPETSTMLCQEESRRCALVSVRDTLPTYAKELIAGGAAGGIAKTIVAPLERVKILYQVRISHSSLHACSLGWTSSVTPLPTSYAGFHSSAFNIRKHIYSNGSATPLLFFMPLKKMQDAALEDQIGAGVDLLAGSMAGGTAVLCTYPLDLARTRLAYQVRDVSTSATIYKGIGDVFSKALKESGFRGLYRGVGPTLYGMLPYAGLKFYIYEKLKASLPSECQSSIFSKLACGAVAGLTGQTIIYPLDVVRRQMQVQSPDYLKQGYSSTLDGLLTVVRTQGVRQLYAGLSINHIKLVPSVAIGFATYDALKNWLRVPPRETGQRKSVTA